ncbi:NADH-quinone oxidoreductase subunit A [Candidatus Sumerlaeota bacterium]
MIPDVQSHLNFDFGVILIFALVGTVFVLINLVIGRFIRLSIPNPHKKMIYECGEPTVGSSWIRYNIRFYTIALVFLIFDVEVVFLFPVILVLRSVGWTAFFEILFFIGILILGLIYAWRFGNLDWIREDVVRPGDEEHGQV